MDTTYRKKESPAGELKDVPVWQRPKFQRFAAIVLGTGLLLSLVAVFALKHDVNTLTERKLPYIENRVNNLQAR